MYLMFILVHRTSGTYDPATTSVPHTLCPGGTFCPDGISGLRRSILSELDLGFRRFWTPESEPALASHYPGSYNAPKV
jgi:hypothetical protein